MSLLKLVAGGMDEFRPPLDNRDRYRNLDSLVQLILQTGEDPLIVASSAGVSPSALVAALPRSFLSRFVPDADSLPLPELMLRLASIHAVDVSVGVLVDPFAESRTRTVLARDLLNRNSLVGAKNAPPPTPLRLSDESLGKLLELERAFLGSGAKPQEVSDDFLFALAPPNSKKEHPEFPPPPDLWSSPPQKLVRDLDFDK